MISFGAAIWGHKELTCISAVQNRAMWFFLGVGKYTPNAAVLGEMGWIPPCIRQWTPIAAFWSRMSCTNSHSIHVFLLGHQIRRELVVAEIDILVKKTTVYLTSLTQLMSLSLNQLLLSCFQRECSKGLSMICWIRLMFL